jgi:hypothetical protein
MRFSHVSVFGHNLPTDMVTAAAQVNVTKSVFSTEYQSLLALLIKVRSDSGLTQQEVGKRLGRDQSYVSKYERGVRRLDVVEFVEVTRVLGVDPFDLLRQIMGGPDAVDKDRDTAGEGRVRRVQ